MDWRMNETEGTTSAARNNEGGRVCLLRIPGWVVVRMLGFPESERTRTILNWGFLICSRRMEVKGGAEFIPDAELTARSLRIHRGVCHSLPRSISAAIPTLSSKLQFSQQCSLHAASRQGRNGWWVRRRMQYQVCLPNCNLARRRKRDVIGLIGRTNRVR